MANKIILPKMETHPARATVNGVRRYGSYFEKDGQSHFICYGGIGEPDEHWVLPRESIELADPLSNPTSPLLFED
jgi:hypothetical protein